MGTTLNIVSSTFKLKYTAYKTKWKILFLAKKSQNYHIDPTLLTAILLYLKVIYLCSGSIKLQKQPVESLNLRRILLWISRKLIAAVLYKAPILHSCTTKFTETGGANILYHYRQYVCVCALFLIFCVCFFFKSFLLSQLSVSIFHIKSAHFKYCWRWTFHDHYTLSVHMR